MPDGPLFQDTDDDFGPAEDNSDAAGQQNGGEREDPGQADDQGKGDAAFSKSQFEDRDSSSVVHCRPGKKKSAKKVICTVKTVKKNLDSCDGGSNAWVNAKKAAGKEPTVKVGKTISKMAAETSGSTITIGPTSNCCDATESLLFELHNVESQKAFSKIDSDAAKGVYSREDFTRAQERVEYDGLKRSWETFDKCKKKWGCGAGAKSFADSFRKAKNFDDYYKHYLGKSHKDHYRKFWDNYYKSPYDSKHKKGP